MSLRRPTVARLSFTFQYKPFMWCRLNARLRRDFFSLFTFQGVAPDTRSVSVICFTYHVVQILFIGMSIIIPHFPLEESFRHSFGTRINIQQFLLEASFRPSLGTQHLLPLCLNRTS